MSNTVSVPVLINSNVQPRQKSKAYHEKRHLSSQLQCLELIQLFIHSSYLCFSWNGFLVIEKKTRPTEWSQA